METVGEKPGKINKELRDMAKEIQDAYNEDLFNEFLESKNRDEDKFSRLVQNLEALGLKGAGKHSSSLKKDTQKKSPNFLVWSRKLSTDNKP